MAQTVINDKDKGSVIRAALNAMFAELYGDAATAKTDIDSLQTAVSALIAAGSSSPILKATKRIRPSDTAYGAIEVIPDSAIKSTQSIHVISFRGYIDGGYSWSGDTATKITLGDAVPDTPYSAYDIFSLALQQSNDFTETSNNVSPSDRTRHGAGLHKGKGLYAIADSEFNTGSPLYITVYALLLENDPADDPPQM